MFVRRKTNSLCGAEMPCKVCASDDLQYLSGELTASFQDMKKLKTNPLYLCQEILVCLSCGFAELRIPANELQRLRKEKEPSDS